MTSDGYRWAAGRPVAGAAVNAANSCRGRELRPATCCMAEPATGPCRHISGNRKTADQPTTQPIHGRGTEKESSMKLHEGPLRAAGGSRGICQRGTKSQESHPQRGKTNHEWTRINPLNGLKSWAFATFRGGIVAGTGHMSSLIRWSSGMLSPPTRLGGWS